jgi:ATP-dependent Clp protease ATP-binding subunit ClpA
LANGQQKISFRNSYIFLTSNLGSLEVAVRQRARRKRRWWWPQRGAASHQSVVREAVEEFFDPEFFNRIDETVVFDAFDDTTAERVTRKEIGDLVRRLKARDVDLVVDDSVVDFVQRRGFDPVYGARGLRRTIRTELTEPVAWAVLTAAQKPVTLKAQVRDGELTVT